MDATNAGHPLGVETIKNNWIVAVSAATISAGLLALAFIPESYRGIFSNKFLPHSYCYLFDRKLIALHVVSDAAIWLAYLSISLTLTLLVYRTRREVPFSWMFLAFGTFIIACGFTHLMEVVVLWKPLYWLSGDVKVITAVASVITAITLPPLVPKVHRMISESKSAGQYLGKLELANAELSRSNATLKALSARVLQVQDEERRRVARDVHDSAGQMVAALAINVARLKESKDTEEHDGILSDTAAIVDGLNSELRTISHLLHPPLLDEVGLSSALRWYVDGFSKRSGIATSLELDPDLQRLDPDHEIAMFRVVQEALTNVHRHSGASKAKVSVIRENGRVSLEVEDNGRGITPQRRGETMILPVDFGVGISGMRERVAQLGGTLEVRSGPKGTSVIAEFTTTSTVAK